MTTHGYLVFLLRANAINRPKALHRLSCVGPDEHDLFTVIGENLDAMGTGYHADEKSAEGFKVKSIETIGRSTFIKINRGPAGTTGETHHLDTGEAKDTSTREALLSGLRAMFFIPKDSYYGLMFVERIGRRNLKETLNDWVIKHSTYKIHAVIRVESFAEVADWESELSEKQVLRVSEVLERKGSDEDHSTPEDTLLHITVEGGAIRSASGRVKDAVISRVIRRDRKLTLTAENSSLIDKKNNARLTSADAFTVQDEAELQRVTEALTQMERGGSQDEGLQEFLSALTPQVHDGFDHKRFDVSLGTQRPERVFSVERDNIPQYVYKLGGYLDDHSLRSTWVTHAQQILRRRGVRLNDGEFSADATSDVVQEG